MNCAEARDAMLVADPAELAGVGDGELARHVVTCDACGTVSHALGRDLQQLTRSVSRRSARRIAVVSALPIAAAILVVFAVSARNGRGRRRDVSLQSLPPANVISVDVAPGQRAAVLRTADPSVTLVWLREGGE